MKVCNKCKEEKELDQYYRNSKTVDGLAYYCKSCVKLDNNQRRRDNSEKGYKKHNVDNSKYKETRRAYYLKNRDEILRKQKENNALDKLLRERYEQSLKQGKI